MKYILKALIVIVLLYNFVILMDGFDYPSRWTGEYLNETAKYPEYSFASQLGEPAHWGSGGEWEVKGKIVTAQETWYDEHPLSRHVLTIQYTKEDREAVFMIGYQIKGIPFLPVIPMKSGIIKLEDTQPVAGGDAAR
jgi:hypothetical protein